jgi:hypothetical protein
MSKKEYIAGFNDGYAFVMHEIEMLMVKETPEGRRTLSDLLDRLGYAEAQKTAQTPDLVARQGANEQA